MTSSPVYRHLCQLPIRQAVKSITATCVRPYSAPPSFPVFQPGEASERCYSAPCVFLCMLSSPFTPGESESCWTLAAYAWVLSLHSMIVIALEHGFSTHGELNLEYCTIRVFFKADNLRKEWMTFWHKMKGVNGANKGENYYPKVRLVMPCSILKTIWNTFWCLTYNIDINFLANERFH